MNLSLDPTPLLPIASWLWENYGKNLIEWLSKRTTDLSEDVIRERWEKFDWRLAATRYYNDLQNLYGTMRILGMTEPVALSGIFTDVYVLDKPTAWRKYNIQELIRRFRAQQEFHEETTRQSVFDVLQNTRYLYILGKPGAGKTTLLKFLVLQCISGTIKRVPIFISLKAWSDSGLSLFEYMVHQFEICSFPKAQRFIEYLLAEDEALVLFDGLDEVNLERGHRDRITREIRDFTDQFNKIRAVITCRIAASDYQFERFSYFELADFNLSQVNTFVKKWFHNNPIKRDGFLKDFAKLENEGLRDLARTPLLLALLCINYNETMSFPSRRAEIYEEALDALMKRWDTSRSIKRDEVYRSLSLGRKKQLLASVAAETFDDNTIFIRQKDLEQKIATFFETLPDTGIGEKPDAEIILKALEAQHGILVERSRCIYSFSHRNTLAL